MDGVQGGLSGLKGDLVHTRSLKIRTFAVDDERILVEGVLEDERPFGSYSLTNQRRDPGLVHAMVVRLLVGGVPAAILDAEAEMRKVPMAACAEALPSVKKLIGLYVVYGFSKEVKDRLSGVEGCNHLTSLVLTMGSAAVQGMAAHRGRKPVDSDMREAMLNYMKDSCCVWRGDGEILRGVREEMRRLREKG